MQRTGDGKKEKTSIVSLAVLVISVIIVGINLVSLAFPSLIIFYVSGSEIQENPFEIGNWFWPLIVTNIAVLAFAILYYYKKLPQTILNSINFLRNFEISSNVAALVFVFIIFGYIGQTMNEIVIQEELLFGDFERVEKTIEKWPFNQTRSEGLFNRHVGNFFLKVSDVVFDNFKVTPFFASIALLAVTYFFTVKITQKRFAGIVAMLLLFQSWTFYSFDTIASYPNFWALFYLLSLYLLYVKWPLSSISYVASLLSKPLTAPYLPMLLFFIYRAKIPRKQKFYTLYILIGFVAVAAAALLIADVDVGGGITTGKLGFDWVDFWFGFTAWAAQLRFDTIFLLFILPLTVALYITARRGITIADAILVQIVGITVAMAFLSAMTTFDLHPYRYITLVNFFAIGVAVLLSKNSNDGGKGSNN